MMVPVRTSDIPILGKAVDRFSEATVDAGIRWFDYLFRYKSLVNNLSSGIEKLEVQEDRVSTKVDYERASGKVIKDHVRKWQNDVEEIKTRTAELIKQRPSWKLVTRFRLGKKAAKEAKSVAELMVSGVELLDNEIAYLPPEENSPISDTSYQMFPSREDAYGKLWEALVNEDGHPIIGIFGMPGVGKTRMMERACKDAKDKNIFKKVTRANVGAGDIIDVINLQKQLAEDLGCHFESEDREVGRATQLKRSLIHWGETLVILDDVWHPIPLKRIGIDDNPKGCKILMTSRREDVCLNNSCKDPIKIETLNVGEAWDMFRNTVGILKLDSMQNSLTKKVCNECGGLPLLIQAVGNALKCATEDSWKDALSQLQNCNLQDIYGIESRVYTGIKLSFDKLPLAEKTSLLLCSLFPEDAEIEIKMLEDFAKGSQLLDYERNVKGVVDKLRSSCLLLEGKTHRSVKIHDIIRDVARSIAAMDQQYAFLFVSGNWRLPRIDDYSTRKLLQFVESNNFECPTGLVCPYLHTLWLECNNKPLQFPNNLVKGIDNLKILVLKGIHIFPNQTCVQTFYNLNMLILEGCDLSEISLSIVPEYLETLRISECRLPYRLDFSKLKSLRKLEVLSDGEIEIVKNDISTLPPTLLELCIPGGFKIFDAEGKRSVPISSELNKLTLMTTLTIRLEDSESCPAEYIVSNLDNFYIEVGDKEKLFMLVRSVGSEMRSVIFNKRCVKGGGEVLVERAEEVILVDVKGSHYGFSSSNRVAFSTLKRLSIQDCEDMEHLVACTPHNEIQPSRPPSSFSKLTSLEIINCSGMNYLFSSCIAKCLVQLENLSIWTCSKLEVVIRDESAIDGVIIKFPKLKELNISNLQSIRRFYGEKRSTLFSSSTTLIMDTAAWSTAPSDSLFDRMVIFPVMENLIIRFTKISEIWEKNYYKSNSFCHLKLLSIWGCHNLEFAIPLAPTFQNLEKLEIEDCESMSSEVETNSHSNESINVELLTLVALRSLALAIMPALKLTRLNSMRRNIYPNLEEILIKGCNSLRNVFLPSIAKDLAQLKKLAVTDCKMMSEIIGEDEKKGERLDEFVFPELTELYLGFLPNLKGFCFSESVEAPQHQSYLPPKVSFPKLVEISLWFTTIKLDEIELGRNDSTSEIKRMVVQCRNEVQLPSKWQLQLQEIEVLELKNCWWQNSVEHNAGQVLIDPYGTLSFQKLKEVNVDSCMVSALCLCSVFRNLCQLKRLTVMSCPLLEEVLREENNIVGTYENTISVLQLEYISLSDLPKLKSFSRSKSYRFNMPALKSIVLDNCPQMENFTSLEIIIPLLPDFNNQNPQTTTIEYQQ